MRRFGLGIVCGFIICGCVSFSYDRFYLDLENQRLSHYSDPNKDLPLSYCAKSNNEFQCTVMKIDDFFQLKTDYEKLVKQLEECQGKLK